MIKKWGNMIGKPASQVNTDKNNANLRVGNRIQICTEKVQSDTGANQTFKNNRDSLYAYIDIDPCLIGGVNADELAIVCTRYGLIPW